MPLIEAVTCSVADALGAENCGANRIELCVAIEVGGLTPSTGLAREVVARCGLPVVAMVRPRSGGFEYSLEELTVMERDAEIMLEIGIQGVVFGILDADCRIDVAACRRILDRAGRLQGVFHRAFDSTPDPAEAIEQSIDLGFRRILTSGHAQTALAGADGLKRLRDLAKGRIEILAAGGIRADNVRAVIDGSGVDQIHLGPMQRVGEQAGLYGDGYLMLDEPALRAVVAEFKAR